MTVQFPGTKSRAVPIPDIMMAFKLQKKMPFETRKAVAERKEKQRSMPVKHEGNAPLFKIV